MARGVVENKGTMQMRGRPNVALARRCEELRKAAKLSRSTLAALIGVQRITIWKYETAKIHIAVDRLQAMAAYYGCDLREFHKPPGSKPPTMRNKWIRPTRGAPALGYTVHWPKLGDAILYAWSPTLEVVACCTGDAEQDEPAFST
jgi:transcriptional regulator with XRE-family HTH domain